MTAMICPWNHGTHPSEQNGVWHPWKSWGLRCRANANYCTLISLFRPLISQGLTDFKIPVELSRTSHSSVKTLPEFNSSTWKIHFDRVSSQVAPATLCSSLMYYIQFHFSAHLLKYEYSSGASTYLLRWLVSRPIPTEDVFIQLTSATTLDFLPTSKCKHGPGCHTHSQGIDFPARSLSRRHSFRKWQTQCSQVAVDIYMPRRSQQCRRPHIRDASSATVRRAGRGKHLVDHGPH